MIWGVLSNTTPKSKYHAQRSEARFSLRSRDFRLSRPSMWKCFALTLRCEQSNLFSNSVNSYQYAFKNWISSALHRQQQPLQRLNRRPAWADFPDRPLPRSASSFHRRAWRRHKGSRSWWPYGFPKHPISRHPCRSRTFGRLIAMYQRTLSKGRNIAPFFQL